MNFDAEIIFRRTPYGLICDWNGPRAGVAKVYGEQFPSLDRDTKIRKLSGEVYNIGHLKLRVVQFPVFTFEGAGCSDAAAVMLESPHAQLFWLYRENAENFVRAILIVEARLRAACRGFMLRPWKEGERMPLTAWIADRLL